jgi:hypothetical protein
VAISAADNSRPISAAARSSLFKQQLAKGRID